MRRFKSHHLILLLAPLVLALGFVFFAQQKASADYVQHNLVDDAIFLNAASMNHAQIQSFLVARGSYLANYYSFSSRDNANVSASQIIYEAAQDYGINPQVILATLQKEQSLVTATNPTNTQLTRAMGYGCPDGADCNAKYYGFFNQVDNGAWQFRKNFERARGNTSWWSTSPGYACSGATRYYSTGLFVGRNVTFYDDNGTPIRTFTLNNASTASMYCYTPHPYNNPNGLYGNPANGYTGQYYSGSYNFVLWFERWFGSTQPALVVSSPLRVSQIPQGTFTNAPVTASVDLTNNTNAPVSINFAVTVRDSGGGNHDFSLKTITIGARSTATYSDSASFSGEGNYTFGMTSLTNGVWNDAYPTSSSIDNARTATQSILAMPTITVGPDSNLPDMRQGKAVSLGFKVKNNSSQPMDVGKLALALRAANGANVDLPLVATGSIAAGATWTYSQAFTPLTTGNYSGFITATKDNGVTWNEDSYPATANGVSRTVSFTTRPNTTLTQGPALSDATPHVGQQVATSFKVKNFSDSAVGVGYIGLAIRDPQGRNVDSGATQLTVNANSEYTFQANATFQTPGTYTAWVTVLRNGQWDDTSYPAAEDNTVTRKITFTVLPNPTITVAPSITTPDPRVGKGLTASFTMHNFGSTTVNVGHIALAARDPNGKNVDFTLENVSIPAGEDYVYTATNSGATLTAAGTYTAWVTVLRNGQWDDTSYPAMDNSSLQRRITFSVKPSPTLTQGPTLSIASPQVGQQVTTSFKVKNFGDTSVNAGYIGLAIRDPLGRNVDPGGINLTVNANSEYTFQANATFQTPGTYTAWVTVLRNGQWDDTSYPAAENGSVVRRVTFTVTP